MRGFRSTALPVAALALALAAVLSGCAAAAPRPDAPSGAATASASPAPTPSPALTGTPRTVAALGDSLSRGFDACSGYGDCPEVSWSTGTDPRVASIASRLSERLAAPVTAANAARSGSMVDDLARQVDLVVPQQPDVVTLLIGANDVCRASIDQMTPTEQYADQVVAALDRLSAEVPDAVVVVASVPDVTALLTTAADDPTARFIWSRLGGCTTVLLHPQSDSIAAEVRRESVRSRITEYNAVLRLACDRQPRCVYDDDALHAYRPELDQLSALDYFHPSIAGLTELASLEWSALERSGLLPPA